MTDQVCTIGVGCIGAGDVTGGAGGNSALVTIEGATLENGSSVVSDGVVTCATCNGEGSTSTQSQRIVALTQASE